MDALTHLPGFLAAYAIPLGAAAFVAGSFAKSCACHGLWALAVPAAPIRTMLARARGGTKAASGAFFCFAASRPATAEK